jgi:hypothetical protein
MPSQIVEQVRGATRGSGVRERLRRVPVEIALLQVGSREVLACKEVVRIEIQ